MELIFGLASFILLLPVLYFLPLGITGKGKVVIALIALIFAVAAGFVAQIVPLWQNALLVIAIGGGTALLFDRKLGSFFYSNQEDIGRIESLASEHDSAIPVFEKIEPVVPTVVKEDLLLPDKEDTIVPWLEAEEAAVLFSNDELEGLIGLEQFGQGDILEPIERINPVVQNEPGIEQPADIPFLEDIGQLEALEDYFDKTGPVSPFSEVITSPFEEGDLEILIHNEKEAGQPVLDFNNPHKDIFQFEEHDDYLTALQETAAGLEKAAEGNRNV
ncbi:hypothetical protein [Bacillus sp. FJAT-27445]|uniref:hypothetical protein n=1 Tax=Bacillus sp. FJAT-27445 TaxID=1679166 RepID=UPI000743234F|nr:hypothetical protein [Bacillus sp. FJAT-27445]